MILKLFQLQLLRCPTAILMVGLLVLSWTVSSGGTSCQPDDPCQDHAATTCVSISTGGQPFEDHPAPHDGESRGAKDCCHCTCHVAKVFTPQIASLILSVPETGNRYFAWDDSPADGPTLSIDQPPKLLV